MLYSVCYTEQVYVLQNKFVLYNIRACYVLYIHAGRERTISVR